MGKAGKKASRAKPARHDPLFGGSSKGSRSVGGDAGDHHALLQEVGTLIIN